MARITSHASAALVVQPQRAVWGPYLLGLEAFTAESFSIGLAHHTRRLGSNLLVVESLRVGNVALWGLGAMSSGAFLLDDGLEWPDRLVPIKGPCCPLGTCLTLHVYNPNETTLQLYACLWGRSEGETDGDEFRRYLARRGRDQDLTRAALEQPRAAETTPEDEGEAWATPTDES